MQRAAHAATRAFRVERRRIRQRGGIQFNHGIQPWSAVVNGRNAVEVGLCEGDGRQGAAAHAVGGITGRQLNHVGRHRLGGGGA